MRREVCFRHSLRNRSSCLLPVVYVEVFPSIPNGLQVRKVIFRPLNYCGEAPKPRIAFLFGIGCLCIVRELCELDGIS